MNDPITRARERLSEVIELGEAAWGTKTSTNLGTHFDHLKYTAWRLSAKTVIKSLAPNSHFEREFDGAEGKRLDTEQKFREQRGILEALRDDFDGGHLANVRGLIRAEVFAELIGQAQYLLDEGFFQPSAVVAGAVLEDHLRKLCAKHPSITLPNKPKLDGMNAELAKAGEYNVLVQKQVTVWADVRNKAAHGKWTEFTRGDVEDMLRGVLRFLTEYPL
jgi:hypothetical protein